MTASPFGGLTTLTVHRVFMHQRPTPRLTVDRKTALAREDVDDWPGLFQSVFQRWRDRLQAWLEQYPSQLTISLLSAIAVNARWRLQAPVISSLSTWQLKAANRSSDWVGCWLTALFRQEKARARAFDHAHAHAHDLDLDRALARTLDLDRALALARALARDRALDRALDHALARDLALTLTFDLDRASALDPARNLALARDLAQSHISSYISWHLSLTLDLLPEALADDLSHSFPALGVCGLKGRAGDGWLIAPAWIEWNVDSEMVGLRRESPKQQWFHRLINKNYDLVFPLTNVPLGQLRRACPEWRTDRRFRALGVLAYFFLGSEKWLKRNSQKLLDLFKVPHIHALMPKPELWLTRFDDWAETDWSTCGLSALWDIKSGVIYWAEGAHHADDMKRVGKPIEQFIGSKK